MGAVLGIIAALALYISSIFFIGNLAENQGYQKGWRQGIVDLCEQDLKGKLIELPGENWVQCVQYKVPAPMYPVKP